MRKRESKALQKMESARMSAIPVREAIPSLFLRRKSSLRSNTNTMTEKTQKSARTSSSPRKQAKNRRYRMNDEQKEILWQVYQ